MLGLSITKALSQRWTSLCIKKGENMITLLLLLAFVVLFVCIALVLSVGGIFIVPMLVDILVLWLIFHKRKKKRG